MTRILGALIAALLFTLLPSEVVAVGEEEEPMTIERAGAYYTNHVCPVIRAGQKYSRQIWKGRNTIPMREVRRRLPEIRRYAPPYARARYNWARDLYNPPAPWPGNVAGLVQRLADTNVRASDLLWLQSEARTAARWARLNERINDLPSPAGTIRARLNLPRTTNCRR
jgi:hypothetical protein